MNSFSRFWSHCSLLLLPTLALAQVTVPLRKPFRLDRPAAGLDLKTVISASAGESLFSLPWVAAPSSTTARDGLGPLFNVASCRGCHFRGGRGNGPAESGPLPDSIVIRLGLKNQLNGGKSAPDERYGGQLQPRSVGFPTNQGLTFSGEGKPSVQYVTKTFVYPDGEHKELRLPKYSVARLRYGKLRALLSPRYAPSLVGVGLIEEIPEEQITALSDPDDTNGDGISGKPNYVLDVVERRVKLGRYGYKASQPTLLQQTADAFRNDIGITNSLFPKESCSENQSDCLSSKSGADAGEKYEIADDFLEKVALYVRYFGVPERRNAQNARGAELFKEVGCEACHQASFRTRKQARVSEFSDTLIKPYSDFLLHDMGSELGDGLVDHRAGPDEWKTTPLWGIGLTKRVNPKATYLHDGRARTLEEAILWHGGEAESSKEKFANKSKAERRLILRFLTSL